MRKHLGVFVACALLAACGTTSEGTSKAGAAYDRACERFESAKPRLGVAIAALPDDKEFAVKSALIMLSNACPRPESWQELEAAVLGAALSLAIALK